jgi:hypothetical protein
LSSETQHGVERLFVPPSRIVTSGLRWREGRPKGSKTCDFLEVLRFLALFRREARNVYQIYHSSQRFDIKKLYRYLRYCLEIRLLEPDHVEQNGFLHAKYYRLTDKGRLLLELFRDFAWETAIFSQ